MKTTILNQKISYSIACTDELTVKAKNLCHDTYLRMGYINQSYPDRMIPNEFEYASSYIIASNEKNEIIGTLRLTAGPSFTTLKVWDGKFYSAAQSLIREVKRGKAYELGALAVRKEYSGLRVSHGLYLMAYTCAVSLGLDYGIISMDERALRCLEIAGWRAIRIGEPMYYFGSMTVPAILPVIIQDKQPQNYYASELQRLAL